MTEPTYVPVPPEVVDPDVRTRAEMAVGVAAARLGLSVPIITWIVVAPPGVTGFPARNHSSRGGTELAGLARMDSPDRIWIRADLADAMTTACHEVRHLWQYHHLDDFPDEAEREHDAEAWAVRLMDQPLTREELYPWMR